MKTPLVVALLLLAGCAGTSEDSSTSTTSGAATTSTSAVVANKTVLPTLELYNDTLAFASAQGGSAGSGSFSVPAGYGNLTLDYIVVISCPGYGNNESIRVAGPADEYSLSLPFTNVLDGQPVGDIAGYKPAFCSLIDLATDRMAEGIGVAFLPAAPGSWTLEAKGEFTGTVRLVATASA